MIFICATVVGAGGWLFYNKSGIRNSTKPEASNAQTSRGEAAQTVSAENFHHLVGRWIRPDGGYIIEIRNVDSNGILAAAYFNPRPVDNTGPPAHLALEDSSMYKLPPGIPYL